MVIEMIMMQVGLMMSEVGNARTKNSRSIIHRFIMNMMIVGLVYFFLGHEFANGNKSGLLGSTSFDLIELDFKDYDYKLWVIGFIFCQTTNAIACSAFCERTFLDTYVFFTIIMSSIIYPVQAHWVWGGGWLHQMGYHDHGGSGLVHMTAGCAALIGNYILGPRLGFFKVKTPEKKSFAFTRNHLLKSHMNDVKL
jgi:Amt family ammonium transporter